MTSGDFHPLISVIVPVYNADKYLDRCIKSILNQTYDNLDILLIDDGSTDSSKNICESYASIDTRIRVFSKSNSGQGLTRRYGVHEALGDYIAFIDADDYIKPEMYELMLKAMADNSADVVVCQFNYEKINGTHSIVHKNDDELLLGTHNSTLFSHYIYAGGYQNGLVVAPVNKLYKKTLLYDADFSGYIGEDEEMNDYVYSKNCKIFVIPDELYYWCQNLNSTTNVAFSSKRWHFLEMLLKRIKRYSSDSFMVRKTKLLYINIFIEYYYKAKANGVNVPIALYNDFKSIFFLLLFNGDMDLKLFIRGVVFLLSPNLYKRIILKES